MPSIENRFVLEIAEGAPHKLNVTVQFSALVTNIHFLPGAPASDDVYSIVLSANKGNAAEDITVASFVNRPSAASTHHFKCQLVLTSSSHIQQIRLVKSVGAASPAKHVETVADSAETPKRDSPKAFLTGVQVTMLSEDQAATLLRTGGATEQPTPTS